jgi:hypothetical protein
MQQCNNETIYNVIAFFDLFDYPLTVFEVWKYLPVRAELGEVAEAFRSGVAGVDEKQGLYFLQGRQEALETRQSRYISACRKFKKARRMARLFSYVPWVRLVAVGNSIGANNLKEEGDIDFLVVAQDRRLWLTRFFCTGLAKLLRLRPRPDDQRDKICLSFYVSESALDMRPLMLDGSGQPGSDVYFLYWLSDLYPVYDQGGYYEKLVQANHWIFKVLPNWQFVVPSDHRQVRTITSPLYRDFWEIVFGKLEKLVKRWQLAIMPEELKIASREQVGVVVNDQVLKFHLNDRRGEVREKYRRHMAHNL